MKRRRMLKPSSLRGLRQMGPLRWTRHYCATRWTQRERASVKRATHKADRQAASRVAREELPGSGGGQQPPEPDSGH